MKTYIVLGFCITSGIAILLVLHALIRLCLAIKTLREPKPGAPTKTKSLQKIKAACLTIGYSLVNTTHALAAKVNYDKDRRISTIIHWNNLGVIVLVENIKEGNTLETMEFKFDRHNRLIHTIATAKNYKVVQETYTYAGKCNHTFSTRTTYR